MVTRKQALKRVEALIEALKEDTTAYLGHDRCVERNWEQLEDIVDALAWPKVLSRTKLLRDEWAEKDLDDVHTEGADD